MAPAWQAGKAAPRSYQTGGLLLYLRGATGGCHGDWGASTRGMTEVARGLARATALGCVELVQETFEYLHYI